MSTPLNSSPRRSHSSRRRLRWAALGTTAAVVATLFVATGASAATVDCQPAWSSAQAYTGGAQASHNGVNYRAKWWTQGETPGASQWGAWESTGTCGGGTPTPTVSPSPTPTPTVSPSPTPTPTGTPATTNPDEKCRPDGLYQTPGVNVPYCTVYDTAGREKLPNDLKQRVIGYFTDWRTGKDGTPRYIASDIPWGKLNHINYAFGHLDEAGKVSVNQNVPGNAATDMTWPGVTGAAMDPSLPYKGEFNLINSYKKQNPGVKSLISIGGWAETGGHFAADGKRIADGGFYTMTASSAKIDTFATSAVDFIRKYGFDGVDIDYEYPTSNNKAGNPDDFAFSDARRGTLNANYAALMKTLREKLDAASAADGRYYMLTVAAPASGWLLRGMETFQTAKYLDYVNMMTYDLHGSWNNYVGGNAPLFDDGKDPELTAAGVYNAYKGIGYLNGDWAAHYFRGALPAGRINLGVPYYTRGWTGVTGGTDGMGGSAPLADQTKCPAGTGPSLGGTSKCGAGAVGIDNIWHDLDANGNQVPSGVNPIWQVLNLQKGIVGDYLPSYGSPTAITGTYTHRFDPVTKNEWWWNSTTKTLLTGDSDQAIAAKADYVAQQGLGGIMIWELAGDYAYNQGSGQYGMGSTLTGIVHYKFVTSAPYGATKAKSAMPTKVIALDMTFSDFALGDNNYPINPKVTFTNNSKTAIPAGSTITFDTATSDTGAMGEQNGWSITRVGADHSGSNVGGLKGDFYTYTIKVPSGGIPAGGSASTKISWTPPIASPSNLRVTIGSETYGTTYDAIRGAMIVEPTGGTSSGGTGSCTASPWSASTAYSGGAKVTYNGTGYTAQWWTQGETPGGAAVWKVGC